MADNGVYCGGSSPPWSLPEYTTFLGSKGKMSSQEVVETQSIASLRIHVESMGQYSTIHNVWHCKSNVVSVCYVM